MDTRLEQLKEWLNSIISDPIDSIEPASADASFRRYFRITLKKNSHRSPHKSNTSQIAPKQSTLIAMDAPPEHEDNPLFVKCAETLQDCRLRAPKILAKNYEYGFLLVDDLGKNTYQDGLTKDNEVSLYKAAIDALIKLQCGTSLHREKYPPYDESLLVNEMKLFQTWYVGKLLDTQLNKRQSDNLANTFSILTENALAQPQVLVHRDYHCRNLLIGNVNEPGVIDFQDMVVGALSYDLVSLLKDCYIEWPQPFIDEVLRYYLKQLANQTTPKNWNQPIPSFSQLKRWFDLMGIQRHLKVLGIFSRLNYRDSKPQYLNDIPLVKKYILNTCQQYSELTDLYNILTEIEST